MNLDERGISLKRGRFGTCDLQFKVHTNFSNWLETNVRTLSAPYTWFSHGKNVAMFLTTKMMQYWHQSPSKYISFFIDLRYLKPWEEICVCPQSGFLTWRSTWLFPVRFYDEECFTFILSAFNWTYIPFSNGGTSDFPWAVTFAEV